MSDDDDTQVSVPAFESPSLSPPNLFDIRDEAAELAEKRQDVRDKIGPMRSWSKVTGICLHQTAVVLGERPGRWASLGAHLGITRSGKIIWVRPFDQIVWHGNGWNNQTVGIEIDGMYPGIEGDMKTFWKPGPTSEPTPLTGETITATIDAIRWVCASVERHGGKIKVLVAHRQSSKNRRSDPGSAIWQRIAMPMHAELGLGDGGKGFEIGGYPIPEAWNLTYTGEKY